jgi:hypothetical protein
LNNTEEVEQPTLVNDTACFKVASNFKTRLSLYWTLYGVKIPLMQSVSLPGTIRAAISSMLSLFAQYTQRVRGIIMQNGWMKLSSTITDRDGMVHHRVVAKEEDNVPKSAG